eukprot:1370399-Pyramimonas_sp.AAC.1
MPPAAPKSAAAQHQRRKEPTVVDRPSAADCDADDPTESRHPCKLGRIGDLLTQVNPNPGQQETNNCNARKKHCNADRRKP